MRNRSIAYILATNQLRNAAEIFWWGPRMTKRDIFQAISDPTRRAIIVLIAENAMTPNAVADHFEISRQARSTHIQILNKCGLLKQMKSGREIYYELVIEKMHEQMKAVRLIRT